MDEIMCFVSQTDEKAQLEGFRPLSMRMGVVVRISFKPPSRSGERCGGFTRCSAFKFAFRESTQSKRSLVVLFLIPQTIY